MTIIAEVSPAHTGLLSVIFLIPLLLCFVVLTKLSYDFLWNHQKRKLSKKFAIIALVAIVSFCITLFCYYYAEVVHYDVFWGALPYAMVSLFWGHGNAATYILFVERMKAIFGSSVYKSFTSSYTFLSISFSFSTLGNRLTSFFINAFYKYGSSVVRAYARNAP